MSNEFKVGNRVKVGLVSCHPETKRIPLGLETTLTTETGCCGRKSCWYLKDHHQCVPEKDLKKLGGSMSKYNEMVQRINALENGWDKDADDILREIQNHRNKEYVLWIPFYSSGVLHIYDWNENCDLRDSSVAAFTYGNQCNKMEAFKKALLWFLDHSDIKKDLVGTEVKADIEGKIYKVKVLEAV